jgi:dynein heavy chain
LQSFVRLFSSVLRGDAKEDDETAQSNTWLQIAFIFSAVWSLGGTLMLESREKFDTFFRALLSGMNKEFPRCKSFNLTKNQLFPERGSVFDFICDKKDGKWVVWMDIVDRELLKIPQNAKINDLIIPTDDTARQQFFLNTCLKNDYPFLFVGPTGTGKSAITMNWLMSLPKDKYIPIVINFSARTTASLTQDIVMSKLDRRKRGVFGPSQGKKCVVFIDDLSMPQKELYGAQPPIELLRQWVDHGNWYDLKDTSKLALEDLVNNNDILKINLISS